MKPILSTVFCCVAFFAFNGSKVAWAQGSTTGGTTGTSGTTTSGSTTSTGTTTGQTSGSTTGTTTSGCTDAQWQAKVVEANTAKMQASMEKSLANSLKMNLTCAGHVSDMVQAINNLGPEFAAQKAQAAQLRAAITDKMASAQSHIYTADGFITSADKKIAYTALIAPFCSDKLLAAEQAGSLCRNAKNEYLAAQWDFQDAIDDFSDLISLYNSCFPNDPMTCGSTSTTTGTTTGP